MAYHPGRELERLFDALAGGDPPEGKPPRAGESVNLRWTHDNFYYGWGTAAERQQARGQLLFELNRKAKSIGPLSDEQGTRQYAGAHSDNAAATWLVADRDGDHELKAAVEQWFKTWAAYMALHLVPHRRTWLPLTAGPRQGKAIPGQEEPCFGTGSTATSLIQAVLGLPLIQYGSRPHIFKRFEPSKGYGLLCRRVDPKPLFGITPTLVSALRTGDLRALVTHAAAVGLRQLYSSAVVDGADYRAVLVADRWRSGDNPAAMRLAWKSATSMAGVIDRRPESTEADGQVWLQGDPPPQVESWVEGRAVRAYYPTTKGGPPSWRDLALPSEPQQVVLLGRHPPRTASLRELAAVYQPEPGSEALRGFGGGLTAASLAPEGLAAASTPTATEAARRAWAAEGARAFRELAAGRQTWPNLLGHLFRRLRAFGQPRTVTAETLEAAAAVLDAVAAGSSLIDEQVRDALLDALRG